MYDVVLLTNRTELQMSKENTEEREIERELDGVKGEEKE